MDCPSGLRATAWALVAAVVSLTACEQAAPREASAPPSIGSTRAPHASASASAQRPPHNPKPPNVIVRGGDDPIELKPFTYCYEGLCVDGAPRKPLPSVGSPQEVFVDFPLPGWSFDAFFQPAGDECGRQQKADLQDLGDGHFVLDPVGLAGAYDVTLVGREQGDLWTAFRWITPSDGRLPAPSARAAIVSGNKSEPDSYGVELELKNLVRTPRHATAKITVSAANGEALTFTATPARGHCFAEGTVYWNGPDDQGLAAAALGEGPFTYEVRLLLDGTRHIATATWPDDEIKGFAPSVRLLFTPDLPALD